MWNTCAAPAQSLNYVCVFVTPWTVAHQAPFSMEFSRQEYLSVCPVPFLGDLPNSGIEPASPLSIALTGEFFTLSHTGSPWNRCSPGGASREAQW